MRGTIVQVSTSRGGVPKYSVPEANVTPLGLEGDTQAHTGIHGGLDQAILLMSASDIESLRRGGFSVFYGALGENLTVDGINFRQIRERQRFRVGDAILEITTIRQPCRQLDVYGPGIRKCLYDTAVKAGITDSPLWGFSGFYASVIQTGTIRANDIIELLDQAV